MGARRLVAFVVAAAVLLPAAGYATADRAPVGSLGIGGPTHAPVDPYPVGIHTVALSRGANRPLPTTVWYPAATGGVGAAPIADARAAAGRFPLVLFSHGLHGRPERYAALLSSWAAAGFVVAAPVYPHTNGGTARFVRADVRNQPADAAYVIRRLARLDGDPLTGHIAADRVAAVGHSAGGFTTTGLFTSGHDAGLRGGVVIAGWAVPGAFDGPAARMLFVHGSADRVVSVESGRAGYDRVPWPKAFLELAGRGHGEFLEPPDRDHPLVARCITDFLRWVLYDDDAARRRLTAEPLLAAELDG